MSISEPGTDPNLYQANMAALQAYSPATATKVASADTSPCRISVAKNGQPTLEIRVKEQLVQIHSSYNPGREAEQVVSAQGGVTSECDVILLIGCGLGYTLLESVRSANKTAKFIIIEPFAETFSAALNFADFRPFFSDPTRFLFLISESPAQIEAGMTAFIDYTQIRAVGVVELASIRRIIPKYIDDSVNIFRALMSKLGRNLMTLMTTALDYQFNTLDNLQYIVEQPKIRDFFNLFRGLPAIIVSAGPSLDKNVAYLEEAHDKAVIICVDTALKPLLARGIEPHFVVAADPFIENFAHMANLPQLSTYLVVEPMTNPGILHTYPGPMIIASFQDITMKWIESLIGARGTLLAWGSIATMAFDLARKLGASELILIGQDLSFTGNRRYCRHTNIYQQLLANIPCDLENELYENINLDFPLPATDIYGQQTYTNRKLQNYKEWFESELRKSNLNCINCTEGGLPIEHTATISFQEALFRFARETRPIWKTIAKCYQDSGLPARDKLCQAMAELVRSFEVCFTICRQVEMLTETISAPDSTNEAIEAAYAQLPASYTKLMAETKAMELIEMGNQSGCYRFSRQTKELHNAGHSPENVRAVAAAYHSFVSSTRHVGEKLCLKFQAARLDISTKTVSR